MRCPSTIAASGASAGPELIAPPRHSARRACRYRRAWSRRSVTSGGPSEQRNSSTTVPARPAATRAERITSATSRRSTPQASRKRSVRSLAASSRSSSSSSTSTIGASSPPSHAQQARGHVVGARVCLLGHPVERPPRRWPAGPSSPSVSHEPLGAEQLGSDARLGDAVGVEADLRAARHRHDGLAGAGPHARLRSAARSRR